MEVRYEQFQKDSDWHGPVNALTQCGELCALNFSSTGIKVNLIAQVSTLKCPLLHLFSCGPSADLASPARPGESLERRSSFGGILSLTGSSIPGYFFLSIQLSVILSGCSAESCQELAEVSHKGLSTAPANILYSS
jgi:hypothetical protein